MLAATLVDTGFNTDSLSMEFPSSAVDGSFLGVISALLTELRDLASSSLAVQNLMTIKEIQ